MKKPNIGREILIAGAALALAGCATLKEEVETRFGSEIQEAKEKLKKAAEIAKRKAKEGMEEAKNELPKKN